MIRMDKKDENGMKKRLKMNEIFIKNKKDEIGIKK